MKILTIIYLILFHLANFSMAHKQPSEISGLVIYDAARPLEVHIFTSLPLLQEYLELDFISDLFHIQQSERLEKAIFKNKDNFIQFSSEGKNLGCFIKKIDITPDIEDQDLPPGLHHSQNIDISITLLFATPLNTKKLKGTWLIFPDSLLDLDKAYGKTINPKMYETSTTIVGPSTNTFTTSSSKPSFQWESITQVSPETPITYRTQEVIRYSHQTISFTIIGCSLVFMCLVWIFGNHIKTRRLFTAALLTGCLLVVFFTDLKQVTTQKKAILPEGDSLNLLLRNRLQNIYQAITSRNEDKLYNQLSTVSSDKFLHEAYQNFYTSIFINTDTLKIIDKVTIKQIERLDNKRVKCHWEIDAMVRHLNHIHAKNLNFSAEFHFDIQHKKWLISSAHILPIYELSQK